MRSIYINLMIAQNKAKSSTSPNPLPHIKDKKGILIDSQSLAILSPNFANLEETPSPQERDLGWWTVVEPLSR